jgi:hypothetical protein
MDQAQARARLDLSRQVITGWENAGMAGNRVEDKMRMIFAETQILYDIEHGFPEFAEDAKAIGARYSALAMEVKRGA